LSTPQPQQGGGREGDGGRDGEGVVIEEGRRRNETY